MKYYDRMVHRCYRRSLDHPMNGSMEDLYRVTEVKDRGVICGVEVSTTNDKEVELREGGETDTLSTAPISLTETSSWPCSVVGSSESEDSLSPNDVSKTQRGPSLPAQYDLETYSVRRAVPDSHVFREHYSPVYARKRREPAKERCFLDHWELIEQERCSIKSDSVEAVVDEEQNDKRKAKHDFQSQYPHFEWETADEEEALMNMLSIYREAQSAPALSRRQALMCRTRLSLVDLPFHLEAPDPPGSATQRPLSVRSTVFFFPDELSPSATPEMKSRHIRLLTGSSPVGLPPLQVTFGSPSPVPSPYTPWWEYKYKPEIVPLDSIDEEIWDMNDDEDDDDSEDEGKKAMDPPTSSSSSDESPTQPLNARDSDVTIRELIKDDDLREFMELTREGSDVSPLFPSISCASSDYCESDDGLTDEIGALDELQMELRKEIEVAEVVVRGVFEASEKIEGALTRMVQVDTTDECTDYTSLMNEDSCRSNRKVRFSAWNQEFVYTRETNDRVEDESFLKFMKSTCEEIYYAVEDFVEEIGCGAVEERCMAPAPAPESPRCASPLNSPHSPIKQLHND